MKLRGILFFLFLNFVFLSVSDVTAAPGEWVSVRSKNFNLIGNASESDVRAVAAKLEQFRATFQQISRKINFNSPIPTTVVVFKSDADYTPFKPVREDGKLLQKVDGYFLSSEDANYITLAVGTNLNAAYRTIFHEYTHFLLDNNIGRGKVPPWLDEGLAEYYQTFKIENDQTVTLGGLQEDHLRLLAQNNLIPAESFFYLDSFNLYQQSDDGVGLFYAQAWALTHYLKQRKAAETDKFIDLLIAGTPSKTAFEDAFQMNYAAALDELKKYLAASKYSVSNFNLKDKIVLEQEMKSAPISVAEAKTQLGELLTRFDRLTEAENILNEVLKNNPDSVSAIVALGNIRLRQEKFDEAQQYFDRAIKFDDKNYLTYYLYAYAISRTGMSDYGFVDYYSFDEADKMRRALRKAIALNPNFAESYELYGLVAIVRNEGIDEGIEFLKKALSIAPGNQDYQIRLAELYLWKEDFENARKLAQIVARTASEPKLKLYAENTISKINNYQAQLESIKQSDKGKHPEIPDRTFSEEELRQIREKGFIESINRLLTVPKPDERRILGYLTRIECQPKSVLFYFNVENRVFKFRSDSFDSVTLVALNAEMFQKKLACGEVGKTGLAVILFHPDDKQKISGVVRAIEFVPPNFKLLN